MSFDPTSEDLSRRGRAHTRLRELLDARGPATLHPHERDRLVDGADALLFGEPDALERRDEALDMLDDLVDSGRWEASAANAVAQALRACGQTALKR